MTTRQYAWIALFSGSLLAMANAPESQAAMREGISHGYVIKSMARTREFFEFYVGLDTVPNGVLALVEDSFTPDQIQVMERCTKRHLTHAVEVEMGATVYPTYTSFHAKRVSCVAAPGFYQNNWREKSGQTLD
jgi:hypothetical protein